MGSSAKIIKRDLNNQQVLDAVVALTGSNLGFDKTAWKNWYSSQQKPGPLTHGETKNHDGDRSLSRRTLIQYFNRANAEVDDAAGLHDVQTQRAGFINHLRAVAAGVQPKFAAAAGGNFIERI